MFSAIRASASRAPARAFSTSSSRLNFAKLTLVGRLGRDPEIKTTKNDKEYVIYTVATTNSVPPPGPDGQRVEPTTSWHRIMAFGENQAKYLMSLRKGSLVYVEAAYEYKEAERDADPSTPQGQRQVFLRHDKLKVLQNPREPEHTEDSE